VRVLIDYRPALRERSGAGEYTHRLVQALSGRFGSGNTPALDLSVFSSSWKDRLTPNGQLGPVSIVDRRVPVSILNFMWHRLGWPPAERVAGGAFDVTHSSHPLILPARHAAHVVTIHDVNFLSHPERTRAEVRRDYPALAKSHAQRADGVLVPSAFTSREVQRHLGVPSDRIVIAPPGAPDWTPRSTIPRDGYVLFLGTLEPRKNIGGLLDAYERVIASYRSSNEMPPTLVLAGKATDDARAWLDRIAQPPLSNAVRHIGWVAPEDTRNLYEGARLLVLPSFDEGFGIPVLEAMTAGVPVVAANRGSLPEVLGDAGPLVDPGNPDDIAHGLMRVLRDGAYSAACVERGLARARRFDWTTTAERVFDAYSAAMERHAHRR